MNDTFEVLSAEYLSLKNNEESAEFNTKLYVTSSIILPCLSYQPIRTAELKCALTSHIL